VRIALVSDSHGLAHPGLPALFQGCERILHAGDLVRASVLEALAAVAPVAAVRGNNDLDPAFDALPETALVPLGDLRAFLVHDLGSREHPHPRVRAALARARPDVVIHGHSHRPGVAIHAGRLYVNPGSAGPQRFALPRTAAILTVSGRRARVAFYELSGERPQAQGDPFEAEL
jgi:putative phosphoesterase